MSLFAPSLYYSGMNKNTRFNKDSFRWDGMYLNYVVDEKTSPWGEFVARFKHNRRDRASFQKFLTGNFTVKEYFDALAANRSPAEILQAKGWISPTVKKALISFGLPPTAEGRRQYAELVRQNQY